jgi:hypothetical protein
MPQDRDNGWKMLLRQSVEEAAAARIESNRTQYCEEIDFGELHEMGNCLNK